ncbi:hypothetical protein [Olivibacter jilunii]|uniref:hypothetical protein n=1 Tax=Olivibacter jilunii TaxID=985016 RepID=UPI003F5CEFAE
MSIAPRLRHAFLDADIQGGSVQWYPVSHNGAFNFKGNLLTHVDKWPKDSITADIKKRNRALMAYEIDAADNGYTYTYPMMARQLREAGAQFATMFSYDPLGIAYSNAEYRTHFMNLAYAAQKALGLKIAGEVFHRIPMGKSYGRVPQDTIFDAFRLSHVRNLAEMVTEEKFIYANSTSSIPPNTATLEEIAGYGSSPIIRYEGRGAYFLDKLEEGVWRLEVMPDATWVDDPFVFPSLDKEVSAIVWNTLPMTVDLPDLGTGYRLIGINDGNTLNQSATDKQVSVSPGAYFLIRDGIETKWKPNDRWKNIRLKEYVAPPPTKNSYLLHRPITEVSRGSRKEIEVEIISAGKPEEVKLYVSTSAPRRLAPIDFKPISRYVYAASIPDELLDREGILNYQISVKIDGKYRTYPENIPGTFSERGFNSTESYSIKVVDRSASVCLLDVESDHGKMRKPHRRFDFDFRPSAVPGKSGVVLDARHFHYTSFFFKDKVMGRKEDISTKKHVLLRASALGKKPVTLWVTLQLRDGTEYGHQVTLTGDQWRYKLPLNEFKRVTVDGPGEKGAVNISPYPSEAANGKGFDMPEAETIKLGIVPTAGGGSNPRAVIEYITLE